MTPRSPFRLLALTLLVLPACQGDDLSVGGGEPLEPDDVEEMPAGSASGTLATGAYLFTGVDRGPCACRSGTESVVCDSGTLAGDGLWIQQQDGAIEVRLFEAEQILDDVVLHGGLDDDGTVYFGGKNTVTEEGEPAGHTLNDVQGTLEPRGRGELRWAYRVEAIIAGESFDCDVTLGLSIDWWDAEAVSSCGSDAQCHPSRPFCVDDACWDGAVGSACTFGGDCISGACADDVCVDGSAGSGCDVNSDCDSGVCRDDVCADAADCTVTGCATDQRCFEGACQDGAEGDPCDTPLDCAFGFKCTDGICYDGEEGDPCGGENDCQPGFACVSGSCQDGSEGDPCDSSLQCGADALLCVNGRCQDGSAGDPCNGPEDCSTLDVLTCTAANVCG
ncbi:MAG: hypothetical protein AAGA54_04570 [Myxococcota bacterium]